MEALAVLSGLMGFIALIVFFVMSYKVGNICKNVQSIQQILSAWKTEKGWGESYKCGKCGNTYKGRQPVCPLCGDTKIYR